MNKIDYGTKFKFEWAEGRTDVTDKYVDKELSFSEFIYIITKRHHEIARENIECGCYGAYDKHKVWVKYNADSEWEELGRLDLGNDYDWEYIRNAIKDSLAKYIEFDWGGFVEKGYQDWKEREKNA